MIENHFNVSRIAPAPSEKENSASPFSRLTIPSSANLENVIPASRPPPMESTALITLSLTNILARFHFPMPRIL